MASKLAATVFGVDPVDIPITKDVYQEDILNTANSYTIESPEAKAAASYVNGLNSDVTDLIDSIITEKDAIIEDWATIKSRMETLMGPGTSAGLSEAFKKDIINELNNPCYVYESKLIDSEGNSSTVEGDNEELTSTLNGIDDSTGDSSGYAVTDPNALAAYILATANRLLPARALGPLDTLVQDVGDAEVQKQLYKCIIKKAAYRGSVSQVQYFANKVESIDLFTIHETVITNLMSRYVRPNNELRGYSVVGKETLALFKQLNEQWNTNANDASLVSLKFYLLANEDMAKELLATDDYRYVAAAQAVETEPPTDTVDSLFPSLISFRS